VRPSDALPTNRTWQPSCSHGTYQHKTITSRSRQLLMMGTWLPETCWTTIRREIKNTKVTSSWFFLSTNPVHVFPFCFLRSIRVLSSIRRSPRPCVAFCKNADFYPAWRTATEYIRSCLPYLEAVCSIPNLRTRHFLVTVSCNYITHN